MMRSKNELPIIFVPQLEPKGQRTLEGMLKFILTVIFILILAVLTLALWIASGFHVQEQVLADAYIKRSWGMLFTVGWVALAAFLIMLVWQQYNLRVFGKRTRRQFPPPVGPAEVARMLQISEEAVVHAQSLRIGVFYVKDGKRVLCDDENVCMSLETENTGIKD